MTEQLTKTNLKMRHLFALFIILFTLSVHSQIPQSGIADSKSYLSDLKIELQKEWPKNRTINIAFHGHSVPSGYFKTPVVNTLSAYPHLFLKKLKEIYPFAVVNVIITAIGGENSLKGAERFERDVIIHKPDLIFIDYGLNDRGPGLEKSYIAWNEMIKAAKERGIKVILLTPSPDQKVNYSDPDNELKKHAAQIRKLAGENEIGLADSYKAFEFLYPEKQKLSTFMSQVNHPNELGHELIANEIMKWFQP
jgi:acyl-CoA thioesterase I